MWLTGTKGGAGARGAPARGGVTTRKIFVPCAIFPPRSEPLFRIIHLFHVEPRASVTHVQTAHPKNDVLRDVGGMIRNALQISRRQHELQVRRRLRGFPDHSSEQVLKNLVAVAVYHIVRLQDLAGEYYISKDQRA